MRAEPSDKSEIVTQLLFGESFELLSTNKQWVQVRCLYDDYTGWIDEKQFLNINQKRLEEAEGKSAYSLEIAQSAISGKHHIPVLLGSTLPFFDGMNCRIGKEKFIFNGQAYNPFTNGNSKSSLVQKVAMKYLNAPYMWGGRSPFGIDCSGFTQCVFKILGIPILRDAYQQAEQGSHIGLITEAKEGDLAFFSDKSGDIAHTGIILSDGRIIHAYGNVRIDKIDHYGIFSTTAGKYTHQLRMIKRVIV